METKAATFTAHGHDWTPHTPGDPMPCEPLSRVQIFLRILGNSRTTYTAQELFWGAGPTSGHGGNGQDIIGWRYAEPTPPQVEKKADELAALRLKLENAEESLDDIFSEVCDRASHDPNASASEKLAQRVLSHVEFYHQEKAGLKLSWKDKQIAGLEESLLFAKEGIKKKDAELSTLREENESMRTAIKEAHETLTNIHHSLDCRINFDQACDCGKNESLSKLRPFFK